MILLAIAAKMLFFSPKSHCASNKQNANAKAACGTHYSCVDSILGTFETVITRRVSMHFPINVLDSSIP